MGVFGCMCIEQDTNALVVGTVCECCEWEHKHIHECTHTQNAVPAVFTHHSTGDVPTLQSAIVPEEHKASCSQVSVVQTTEEEQNWKH